MNTQFQKFDVKGCEGDNYYEEEESTTTTTTTTTTTVTQKNHILTTTRKTVRGNTALRFPGGGTLKPTQPTTAPPPPNPSRNDTDDYNITTPNPDTDNGDHDDLVTTISAILPPIFLLFGGASSLIYFQYRYSARDGSRYRWGWVPWRRDNISNEQGGGAVPQPRQGKSKKSTRKQRKRRFQCCYSNEEQGAGAAGPTGGEEEEEEAKLGAVKEGLPLATGVQDLVGAVGGVEELPRVHTPPPTPPPTSKWGIVSPYWYHHQSGVKNKKGKEKKINSFQEIPMDDYPPSESNVSTDSNIEMDETPFMTPIPAKDLYEKDSPETERKNVLYSLYDTLFDFDPMQTIRDLHMPGLRNRVPPLAPQRNVKNI